MITIIVIVLLIILTMLDLIFLLFFELADWMIRIRNRIKQKRGEKYEEMVMDLTGGADHRGSSYTGNDGGDQYSEIQ